MITNSFELARLRLYEQSLERRISAAVLDKRCSSSRIADMALLLSECKKAIAVLALSGIETA